MAAGLPGVPTSADAPPGDATALDGVWRGSYTCSQGPTLVTMEIDGAADGGVEAVFRFGPHPDSPGVPDGAALLGGTFHRDGTLELTGVR